jgi:hypothetical protein
VCSRGRECNVGFLPQLARRTPRHLGLGLSIEYTMSRQDTTAGDEGSASHQMRQDQKSPGEPAWDGWLAELQSAEAELANR